MNHRAKRYITILLTIVFCVCAFSAAAFAETRDKNDKGGRDGSSGLTSAASDSSEQSSSSPSSSEPFVPATVQITLIYDNGSQTEVKTVDVGTPVSALPVPSRKGYKFAGWSSGGRALSSSEALNSNAVLTASWTEIAVSSAPPASRPVQSSQKPVDTHESEVEALASEAGEATSDPDALGSQDWSELLSSAPDSSAASAPESDVSSAAEETTSGGFSWLFAVGVALIVLALGGIGLFVYLQFFSGPRGGGKGPGPGGRGKKDDDTMVFTDVSSFSGSTEHAGSGKNPDLDDTIPIGPRPVPPAKKSALPQPAPAPDEDPGDAPSGISEAKPVNGEKSSFDWEKFFNEDE